MASYLAVAKDNFRGEEVTRLDATTNVEARTKAREWCRELGDSWKVVAIGKEIPLVVSGQAAPVSHNRKSGIRVAI